MNRVLLEVCVEDARGIAAAVAGGADRIELCAALDIGGLTPPVSLVRAAAHAPLPVHLLARPRVGGFHYDAADQALVAEDIRTAADAGLAGVVIGASTADGRLDTACLARWVAQARALGTARGRPLALTLHRAFDLVPDLPTALEEAVSLGFARILTSGGQPRAIDALPVLRRLVAQAGERIGILAGSGISAATLPAILGSGVREVHASCRTVVADADPALLRFGFTAAEARATDPAAVAALVHMLRERTGLE
ncbi:MAG: copper homeostasis protein CutC [Sphingomonas taxi]|uniref:PF03932 family protein CutC n=1 Tax=Sphingomonas taxi TaxID=1549858 RepID=A0A2W5P3W8_9SPHN|nr:MAG: copper homeostasis protein CutC [Sphingomonas taxi]